MKSALLVGIAVFGVSAMAMVFIQFGLASSSPQLELPAEATKPLITAPVLLPWAITTPVPAIRATPAPTPVVSPPIEGTPLLAPAGTLPIAVSMVIGQSVPFMLNDGTRRYVRLKGTEQVFAYEGFTVWATATVEVSAPGMPPETAVIPAALFHSPTILNGVRVMVTRSKFFDSASLLGAAADTTPDVTLALTDGKYTTTDVTRYRWPFPTIIWQEGSTTTYPEGLQQSLGGLSRHSDATDIGMPRHTPVHAWSSGILAARDRGFDRSMWLNATGDGFSVYEHQMHHIDKLNNEVVDQWVEPGDFLGLTGWADWWHAHVNGAAHRAYMLGEWYTAHASPVALSYIKDWLITGPYKNPDDSTRLSLDYLAPDSDESMVEPKPGDPASGGNKWELWDNLVPGVVYVGEAVDPYPNSHWAYVSGNYPTSAAYLATYLHTDAARSVVLNIGSSDAVQVFLNDDVVFTGYAECPRYDTDLNPDDVNPEDGESLGRTEGVGQSMLIDEYKVAVDLREGWSRLLVKVAQQEGCHRAWQLSLRVSDEVGNPIPDLLINPLKDPSFEIRWLAPPLGSASTPEPVASAITTSTPMPTPASEPSATPAPTPEPSATPAPTPQANLSPTLAFTPPTLEWLHVEGSRIVDESGDPVVLRGVNIENREWEWAASQTLDFERAAIPKATGAPPEGWGANVVLLAFASGPVNRNDTPYLAALDELVSLAKANGAHTLLVYRYPEPDGDQPNMPDQAAEDALASLAARYTNEPAVLYGLQVEPHNVSWSELKPRFTSMIDAIQASNSRALIAVPGTQWSRYIDWALTDPIPRDNLIYKTHPYDAWSTIQSDYQLAEVAAVYPVILGEFGDGASMNLEDVNNLLDFAEAQGISWIGWLFHEKACPCMLSDASTFATTPYGEEIKARIQAKFRRTIP